MNPTNKFIQFDEEGFFHFNGQRIVDTQYGLNLLQNLKRDDKGRFFVDSSNTTAWVEAFDQPLVVQQVFKEEAELVLLFSYGLKEVCNLQSLSLDEWDRFLGRTEKNIPYVFSRKAQAEFFNILDEFSDTTITFNGSTYEIPDYYQSNHGIEDTSFWTNKYNEGSPGWELQEPSKPLTEVLPQIKLPKSKVLILGCGSGNDAAYLAEQGHIITAVDFSEVALEQAQEKFSNIKDLELIQCDALNPPQDWIGQYDLIFEHTFYCAIEPKERNKLVKIWKKMLHDQGHLLGVFFTFDKAHGPPFGSSEWELRERLKKDFEFLYWTRWKTSAQRRIAFEHVIYASLK